MFLHIDVGEMRSLHHVYKSFLRNRRCLSQPFSWLIAISACLITVVDSQTTLSALYTNCETMMIAPGQPVGFNVYWHREPGSSSIDFAFEVQSKMPTMIPYAAFGFSGSSSKPLMKGGDVFLVDVATGQPRARDFNLNDVAPCMNGRGVCPDEMAGGRNDVTAVQGFVQGSSYVVEFTTSVQRGASDPTDYNFDQSPQMSMMWALGPMQGPTFEYPGAHQAISKSFFPINFGRAPLLNCRPLTMGDAKYYRGPGSKAAFNQQSLGSMMNPALMAQQSQMGQLAQQPGMMPTYPPQSGVSIPMTQLPGANLAAMPGGLNVAAFPGGADAHAQYLAWMQSQGAQAPVTPAPTQNPSHNGLDPATFPGGAPALDQYRKWLASQEGESKSSTTSDGADDSNNSDDTNHKGDDGEQKKELSRSLQRIRSGMPSAPTPAPAMDEEAKAKGWQRQTLTNVQVMNVSLGPAGGKIGYNSLNGDDLEPPLVVYYVNGIPMPDIVLQYGVKYTFNVATGLTDADELFVQPMVFTTSPEGGKEILKDSSLLLSEKMGGRLCLWTTTRELHEVDADFAEFQKTLSRTCEDGKDYIFVMTPTTEIPSEFYYQSLETASIGGTIRIVEGPPPDAAPSSASQRLLTNAAKENSTASPIPASHTSASPSVIGDISSVAPTHSPPAFALNILPPPTVIVQSQAPAPGVPAPVQAPAQVPGQMQVAPSAVPGQMQVLVPGVPTSGGPAPDQIPIIVPPPTVAPTPLSIPIPVQTAPSAVDAALATAVQEIDLEIPENTDDIVDETINEVESPPATKAPAARKNIAKNPPPGSWTVKKITGRGPRKDSFSVSLGPSGNEVGYRSTSGETTSPVPELVFYVNGNAQAELHVTRGVRYTFNVSTGSKATSSIQPEFHQPFYVSNDPIGGPIEQRKSSNPKWKGFTAPTQHSRLCLWKSSASPDALPSTFDAFQKTLTEDCSDESSKFILVEWVPDRYTPELVYYHSTTSPAIGWEIHVYNAGANLKL